MTHILFTSLSHLPKDSHNLGAVELRLDLFQEVLPEKVNAFIKDHPHPVLLTIRKRSHGGQFQGSELQRIALIEKLLSYQPAFFDLEYDITPSILQSLIENHPTTKFIISYHNFEKTPENLEEIYQKMQRYPAFTYKISAFSQSTNDALTLLLFSRRYPQVSGICMGEVGSFARILGKIFGNKIGYAALDKPLAPGQLSHQELQIYRYNDLTCSTRLYGLIGDPVSKSLGHIYHNKVFSEKSINAVYVKMVVKPEELATFLPLAQEIGFQGLSVTMPLKESIFPFVEILDPRIYPLSAINTLIFTSKGIYGTNTDGIGALNALEKKILVKDKIIVLLGTGGASQAIAFEAKKRGANLIILNRTLAKAQSLAKLLNAQSGTLSDMPSHYDILINTAPTLPITQSAILPSALVMDIVYNPKETLLLQAAQNLGSQILYGEEMFFEQASAQSRLWLS